MGRERKVEVTAAPNVTLFSHLSEGGCQYPKGKGAPPALIWGICGGRWLKGVGVAGICTTSQIAPGLRPWLFYTHPEATAINLNGVFF